MAGASCTVEPIPSWLDPRTEITVRDDFGTPAQWTVGLVDYLRTLGVPAFLGFQLAAHFDLESGNGQHVFGYNIGGVRASKGWADQYKATRGRSAPWWRADKHGTSYCRYFRGYDSLAEFLTTWLQHYVPKPAPGAPLPAPAAAHPNYARAGWQFWHYDPAWFASLLAEGYRDDTTAANPDASIITWEDLSRRAGVEWTQKQLGLAVDGDAGAATLEALRRYRAAKNLPAGPVIDRTTTEALERDHAPSTALETNTRPHGGQSGFARAIPALFFTLVTYLATSRKAKRR